MVMAARAPVLSSEAAVHKVELPGCLPLPKRLLRLARHRANAFCSANRSRHLLDDVSHSESAAALHLEMLVVANCPSYLRLVGVVAKAGGRPREWSRTKP